MPPSSLGIIGHFLSRLVKIASKSWKHEYASHTSLDINAVHLRLDCTCLEVKKHQEALLTVSELPGTSGKSEFDVTRAVLLCFSVCATVVVQQGVVKSSCVCAEQTQQCVMLPRHSMQSVLCVLSAEDECTQSAE